MCRADSFWRHLKADVFDVDWRTPTYGVEKCWVCVEHFIEGKFFRAGQFFGGSGTSDIEQAWKDTLQQNLHIAVNKALNEWQRDGNAAQVAMCMQLLTQIPQMPSTLEPAVLVVARVGRLKKFVRRSRTPFYLRH